MLSKELILKLFDLFNMKRWNDYVTPVPLMEMDKQAHKMIVAYLIAKIEENEFGTEIDYELLIEGAIIETLHRSLLTDLRPSVSYQLMKEKKHELNVWIVKQLMPMLDSTILSYERVMQYLGQEDFAKKEKEILASAHFLSTHWEFQIVEGTNQFSTRLKSAKKEIDRKYIESSSIPSVKRILLDSKLMEFIGVTAELRFQERWAQAMRVPKTNVLGHMYFVAVESFFVSKKMQFCPKRVYNNFFVSLFHDLPEVMVRDIASPIKAGIEGLEHIVKEQEKREMEENIYPLLPEYMLQEFKYFIEDEFSNRVIREGEIQKVQMSDMEASEMNRNELSPVDGKLLKWCDDVSAYLEATLSIEYGITSKQLRMARQKIVRKYEQVEFKGEKLADFFDLFE